MTLISTLAPPAIAGAAHRFFFSLFLLLTVGAAAPALGQNWQWVTGSAAGTNSSSVDNRADVVSSVVDAMGNTYAVGSFVEDLVWSGFSLTTLGANNYTDGFVAKISPVGQLLWIKQVGGGSSGNRNDYITDIAMDGNGNLTLVGHFLSNSISFSGSSFSLTNAKQASTTTTARSDIFVARISPAGSWLQVVRAGEVETETATAVAVDAVGNAVIAGNYFSNIQFGTNPALPTTGSIYVASLSTSGSWTRAVSSGSNSGAVSDIARDAVGNIVITGSFYEPAIRFGTLPVRANAGGTSVTEDGFVARLNAAGTWTSYQTFGDTGRDGALAVAFTPSGNIVTAGVFNGASAAFGSTTIPNTNPFGGATGTFDAFVAWLDPAVTGWTQAIGAGGAEDDEIAALTVRSTGEIVVTGKLRATANFGPLSATSAGGDDAFVAMCSSAGTWTSLTRGGGTGNERGRSVAISTNGEVTLAGTFSGIAVFGSTTLPSATAPRTACYAARLSAGVTAPANDLCAGSLPVLACGSSVTGTTIGSGNTDDPTGTCGNQSLDASSGGVFYLYSTPTTGAVTLSLCNGTTYDAKLFVFSGSCSNLLCEAGDDDGCGTTFGPSTVTFSAVANRAYYVYVSGYSNTATGVGSQGPFTLSAACVLSAPPEMAAPSVTVSPNPTATGFLTVALTGNAQPLTLSLTDALGRPVLTTAATGPETTLDVRALSRGVYVLRAVQPNGQALTRRVAVE